VEIAPETERTSLYGTAQLKLGASGFKAFGDFAITHANILGRIAPYPADFALSTAHPYFASYVDPYLTAVQRANVTAVNVKYRLYDMGRRAFDFRSQATHLVAGVEGELAGWDVNSAVTYSKFRQPDEFVGGFPLATRFNEALESQAVDPFPYPLGTMPAAMMAALNGVQFIGTYNTIDIKMTGIDARASRKVFAVGDEPASLGLGVDFRQTGFALLANQAVAHSEILFDGPQAEYDLKRKSAGVFAELMVPVTHQLEITGGVRHDAVSGVDDRRSGARFGGTQDASTFKMSGRYRPTQAWTSRASYGTGFRTASMQQIAQPLVDAGVTAGGYPCPFTATYDPLNYIGRGYLCDDPQKEVFQGGNAELKPERSSQWSLGASFEPTGKASVSVDVWSVRITDAVSAVNERQILGDPAKYLSLYTTKVKASNGLTYVAIKRMPINIARAETQGVDWDLAVRHAATFGQLTGRITGTYLIKSRYTAPGTDDQWETSLGRFGSDNKVSFRNVVSASAALDTATWSHTLRMNYRSGYKDQFYSAASCLVNDGTSCVDVQLDVPAHYTFDWQTRWNIVKGLELTADITNLTDRRPPLSLRGVGSHQFGYDPRYASPYGRTFQLAGRHRF
jgi:iron complex outermembrane recepter protein